MGLFLPGKPNPEAVLVNCQYSMAVFSTGERKRRPRGDRKSQEMSIHLRQTFEAAIKTELYPRSQIDIFVEVLQGKLEIFLHTGGESVTINLIYKRFTLLLKQIPK